MSDYLSAIGRKRCGVFMLKRSHREQLLANSSVPLSLASILLVEAGANLRDSWRLLGSLKYPVLAA